MQCRGNARHESLPKLPAESMHAYAHLIARNVQRFRNLCCVKGRSRRLGERGFQQGKGCGVSGGLTFLLYVTQCLRQQRQRPSPVIERLRCFLRERLRRIARLGIVESHRRLPAATFRCCPPTRFIRQPAVHLMQQKRPQPPALLCRRGKVIALDKPHKKSLHGILRILRPPPAPPQAGIERIPIHSAQFSSAARAAPLSGPFASAMSVQRVGWNGA